MKIEKCPKCGSENVIINNLGKRCGDCGNTWDKSAPPEMFEKPKKQGGKGKKILLIILCVFVGCGVIGALFGKEDKSASNTSETVAESNSEDKAEEKSDKPKEEKKEKKKEEKKVEYITCTVKDMQDLLDKNALNAKDTYLDKNVEVTGRLDNIDSGGSYISINASEDDFLNSIQCFITDDKQLDVVKTLSVGDTVMIKGIVTDVGEVMGYTMDIEDISKQ